MPRLNFVKKARKDYPDKNIKRGDSYYWWQFAYGPKQMSLTKPRRSALTHSNYKATVWDLQDNLSFEDIENDNSSYESIKEELETSLEDLKSELEDSLSNMPEHLQDTSNSGITLTENIEALDTAIDELSTIDIDFDGIDIPDEATDEEKNELLEDYALEKQEEIQNAIGELG